MAKFFVSGSYSDDEEGIDYTRNPSDAEAKSMLFGAEEGNLPLVQSLLSQRPDLVNVTDKEGYTPLHRACYGNHVEVTKFLLRNGANLGAQTELQWQPLHSCCHWNSLECATVLITEGADVNATTEGGQTPLHIAAAQGGSYNIIQLLLMHPFIKPQLRNKSNETAYDIARRRSKFRNVFDMADPLFDNLASS